MLNQDQFETLKAIYRDELQKRADFKILEKKIALNKICLIALAFEMVIIFLNLIDMIEFEVFVTLLLLGILCFMKAVLLEIIK